MGVTRVLGGLLRLYCHHGLGSVLRPLQTPVRTLQLVGRGVDPGGDRAIHRDVGETGSRSCPGAGGLAGSVDGVVVPPPPLQVKIENHVICLPTPHFARGAEARPRESFLCAFLGGPLDSALASAYSNTGAPSRPCGRSVGCVRISRFDKQLLRAIVSARFGKE